MRPDYKFLNITESDGCVALALSRPPVNILNIEMMEEINDALSWITTNSSARVLLLRGEGKCFSAGMDVADHMPDKVEVMLASMHRMFELLAAVEIPTICSIHGAAMGGGLELAAFADMTFAAAGTQLGVPEIKLGVFPPIAVACFVDIVGTKKTYEIVLTGRTFTAEEALEIGMLNAVYPLKELDTNVQKTIAMLTSLSRPVLVATKRALRNAAGKPTFTALSDAERIYMEELMITQDAAEGLRSFLEKRPPKWKHK